MEPEEGELQGLNVGSSNLLALPEPCQWDSDEELLGVGDIEPKSSPIPRRRSSLSCSDDDSQPPLSSSRRVSFADAFGLSLVSVKQFDNRSLCDPTDPLEIDLKNAKEFSLELFFALPVTLEELLCRVQEQKVDLESLELLPETTTIKGAVRVLNMCFDKLVYIRTSLDCWSSHFDLLAEYVPESSQGITDCFSFKLTLVPPFGQRGARVDFCIRYETAFGTFWANNSGQNFVLFCHEKAKEQDENEKVLPKSCLKPARHSFTTSATSNAEEIPGIILDCGLTTATETVVTKEDKTQEGQRKLKYQEESISICSRRSRRKAARMAKLQQYFARKEEKGLGQTEKDTDHIDVPTIEEAPSNLSTQQTNTISTLAEPEKNNRPESIVALDVERNRVSASQTQHQENGSVPVFQPELITPKSQTIRPALDSINSHKSGLDSELLENSQDENTDTSQAVVLRYQTADRSIGKTVEKAWECFEKCAMERIASATDITDSRDQANDVENTFVENKQASQPSAHHFTFETIVAPLYHQVFERMENDRRKFKNSTSEADESAGKRDHGRPSVVTYTNVDTRSNPDILAKHGKDNILESNAAPVFIDSAKRHSSDQQPSFLVEVSTIDRTEKTSELIPLQRNQSLKTQDEGAQTSEQTLNICVKCPSGSDTPLPDSTLFPFDILANVTPKIKHWENLSPSQDLTQATIQSLIPDSIATVPHRQDDTSLIQETSNTCQNSESSHQVGSEMESISNDRNGNVGIWENIENENKTRNTEKTDVCQINNNKEDQSFLSIYPHTATVFGEHLVEDTAGSSIGSNPDHPAENNKENVQVKDPDKNEEQELTSSFRENPSIEVDEIEEVEKQLIEKVEEKQEHAELFKEGSCVTADNEENPKKDAKEQEEAPQRNVVNWKDKKDPEADFQEQLMVDDFRSVATLQSISKEDLFIKEVHQHIAEKQPNTRQLSEEPGGRAQAVCEVEEIVCETGPSQQENTADASQENGDVEENIQVKNPGKYLEQELTSCLQENPSEEVDEKNEVEKREEQENQVENEKFEEGSRVTADNEVKLKRDAEGQDAAPQRNVVNWKAEKDPEADLQEQVTIDGFRSVATLQMISNEESFMKEVHRHREEKQPNTCLAQMSEEPGSEGRNGGVEESFEALDVNVDVAFRGCAKVSQSNSKCINEEKNTGFQVDKDANGELDAMPEKQESDCLNQLSENMDDSTSTESLTDDEMEVYLLRLKNTQQTGLKNVLSMEKRHSISRSWTISSPLPSISEHTDEDQPTALLDDLIPEQTLKLEREALEEDDIEPNLLWWREFFSSENMAKVMVYTLLFVVFLITAYICDFIACFGLYLIALYWLYFQVQGEPLKLKRHSS